MVNQIALGVVGLILKSDIAAEYPLYLYWPKDKSYLLYSHSITELLGNSRVPKPLAISSEGISFLLQSGVVPPPKSAYEDIYILGIGDAAEVTTVNDKLEIIFSHKFPFSNTNRLSRSEMEPDEQFILEALAEGTIRRIDTSRRSYMFHSAGKDSNSIVLALAEAGWQNKVTLVTHQSNGPGDESDISAAIAKKLGFKHQKLYEVEQLQIKHQKAVSDYFIDAPFPCTDNVTLAYPLYSVQVPELKGSNLIDGGGNDSYMMTPPTNRDFRTQEFARLASGMPALRNFFKSESLLNLLLRTQAEWFGISGLSLRDSSKVYAKNMSVYPYWSGESRRRQGWDLYDFKTDILTSITAAEIHIRKARNFADATNSNFILPFANQTVAEYFSKMPESYLFDRKTHKNKLILRAILKDRLGLDSDYIGKMGWTYDFKGLIYNNWDLMVKDIYGCSLWDQTSLRDVVSRLYLSMRSNSKYSGFSGQLINRLYLISNWFSKSKYLNP